MENLEFAVDNAYQYRRSGRTAWILSHVARYPLLPVLLLVTAVVNNLAFSYIQIFVGRGFDRIITPGWQIRQLLVLALAIIASASVQGLTGLSRSFIAEFLAQRVERNSRDELYASLLGKSQTFHGRQRIGDIMARATNDVRMLNMMFNPGVTLILDSALALIIPLVLIASLDLRLLLVPGIFTALLVLTVYHYSRLLKPVSIAQREQFGMMNAGLADAVAGIEVVKSNVREGYELSKFFGNARVFRDYFVRQGRIQAFYLPMLAYTLCVAFAFMHALFIWRTGAISLGTVVAFMGLMGALRFPTFISTFTFNLVQIGLASADRILALINTKTELDQNTTGNDAPIKGAVEFRDVSFAYDGKSVLRNVSFQVKPGQTVAIVGQTGSGKSTLTRLVNRLFDAESGQVLVDGVDVRQWNLDALRSQISSIEQDIFLFSRTISQNIAFGRNDAKQEEILSAAKQAQADGFIREFEHGYETEIGERGVTLSGGQRQRLAIARAFLTNPRILILDDSTSAIDSATEDQIQKAMQAISSQRTTFLITHRLSQIRWADRVIVLKRGEIVDIGSHEELLSRSDDYRKIFSRYN